MNYLKTILFAVLAAVIALSCKPSSRDITPDDFLKMENEVIRTDLSSQSKEAIAKKYGYSLDQYLKFEERAKTDEKLKEQLGIIRLKSTKIKEDLKK